MAGIPHSCESLAVALVVFVCYPTLPFPGAPRVPRPPIVSVASFTFGSGATPSSPPFALVSSISEFTFEHAVSGRSETAEQLTCKEKKASQRQIFPKKVSRGKKKKNVWFFETFCVELAVFANLVLKSRILKSFVRNLRLSRLHGHA